MKMGTMSMLTGASGLTLYVFDADTVPGKSACNGPCAAKWPPLAAPSDAKPVGAYTIVTRDDGSTQWAYKGKPLYFFASDKQPMDTTGDGVAGKWHVASP
jgi:predicted lipoprotein with Yx(FWY)xxD motif